MREGEGSSKSGEARGCMRGGTGKGKLPGGGVGVESSSKTGPERSETTWKHHLNSEDQLREKVIIGKPGDQVPEGLEKMRNRGTG